MACLLMGAVYALWAGLFLVERYRQAKVWNNGICSATGKPWVQFDTDSCGGVGFKSGENVFWDDCWVSGK